MTKSIDDYRSILKILKLQLLKVLEQNSSLSHQMGIVSQSETSSFTPKLNKYKQSDEPFSQKAVLFLQFAHRCQLNGISPQMVFRIADKKRDKSVNVSSFIEVMKRIKIRMSQDDMGKMVGTMAKGAKGLQYQQYLQCLSAFQVNSQKYPITSTRTFVQLCLIQFAKTCKTKYSRTRQLFNEIAQSGSDIYFKYDRFVNFCTKNCKDLKETEIVALFLGLDIQGLCKIEKTIFQREMDKVYSLIERGLADDKSFIREKGSKVSPKKKAQKKQKAQYSDNDDDFAQQESDEGDKKLNKKKKQPTEAKITKPVKSSSVKLDKGILKNIEGLLKQNGFEFVDFIVKLLQRQKDKKDPYMRSFSLGDVNEALLKLNKKFPKKDVMTIFKILDKGGNGSTSTEELLKILIRTDENKLLKSIPTLRTLLYRHLKEIQFPNPILKFTSLGYKQQQKVTDEQLKQVFEKLQLSEDEMSFIFPLLLNDSTKTIEQFCIQLKKQPSSGAKKEFKKMKKQDYDKLNNLLNQINKGKKKQPKSNFKKLTRLQDLKAAGQPDTWDSIFQNQWDCFEHCLNTAYKLETFWRDHQFGPTKSDQHGLRSIIGNESQRPPALPDDEDIMWMTFEDILAKKQLNEEIIFMKKNLKSTDIVQGTLGDCWYVSALSIITQNDQYIKGKPLDKLKREPYLITEGIHPPLFHFFANYGLYVFKFFKKFKPVYVIVDDLFPVEVSSNTLIFAKSPQPQLQWVAFAEKAYAKLHHSYSSMISGDIAQGLNDLTNSIPLKQVLKQQDQQNIDKIIDLSAQGQLMGCSIKIPKDDSKKVSAIEPPYEYDGQRCGLLAGHAYSIIDYIDLKTSSQDFKLIRVRNPHGHSEWLLDWSDNPLNDNQDYAKLKTYQKNIDQYYNQRIKQAKRDGQEQPVPYRPGNDGEFLMNMEDWNKIFNNLFIGLNQSYEKFRNGYLYQTIDFWGDRKPSGVCKSKGASDEDLKNFVKNNHQYIMEVKENTEVLMLMSQQDGRLFRGEKYPYKELVCASLILVFKLESNQRELKSYKKDKMTDPKRSLTLEARRDVDYWSSYEPGRYAILPVRKQTDEKKTQFQFRLFSNKKITLNKLNSKETFAETRIQSQQRSSSTNSLDKKVAENLINFLITNNPKFQKI